MLGNDRAVSSIDKFYQPRYADAGKIKKFPGGFYMATYKEIQTYIREKHGCSVKTCWIAHAKELCGLPVSYAPNRISSATRKFPCPPDKLPYIEDAFRRFGMI